ncbi:hypothetical protein JTB14_023367 [Gonioctena quinquepunctata]|nr:hypothetical protein JTB14_023367 [Gonioctena quinquepunctata]
MPRHDNEDGKSHGNKPKTLVTDEKPQKLEIGIPESPQTPDIFTDCNSTLGTPLDSPSKNISLLPGFLVGDGKPKSTPLPSEMIKSFVGNIENADLISHSNIEILETENIIVEVDDRMKQPLGPSEVDEAAEEGDTVISQSTETSENNTKSLVSDESQINVAMPTIISYQELLKKGELGNQNSSILSAPESNLVPSTSSERRYRRISRIAKITSVWRKEQKEWPKKESG